MALGRTGKNSLPVLSTSNCRGAFAWGGIAARPGPNPTQRIERKNHVSPNQEDRTEHRTTFRPTV